MSALAVTDKEAETGHLLELSGFTEFADQDINIALGSAISAISVAEGGTGGASIPSSDLFLHFRLIWPDDLHVIVSFSSTTLGTPPIPRVAHSELSARTIASRQLLRDFTVHLFADFSVQAKEIVLVAPHLLAKPTPQPPKSAVVARTMIHRALGVKVAKSSSQLLEERLIREQRARNSRRATRKRT